MRLLAQWYSDQLAELKRYKQRVERRWRKSGLNVNQQIYHDHSVAINKALAESKREYYADCEITNGSCFKQPTDCMVLKNRRPTISCESERLRM